MNKPVAVSESGMVRLSRAIAKAEGFYKQGSRPQRNHNPGDLTIDTINRRVRMDGAYVVYRDDGDGWHALERQVWLMLTGKSKYYKPEMTIEQVGELYAPKQPEWARNVAAALGVPVSARICDIR